MSEATKQSGKRRGLAYHSAILVFIIFQLLTVTVLISSYVIIRNALLIEYSNRIQTIVQIEAELIDGDSFEIYTANPSDPAFYEDLKKSLQSAKRADKNIAYLYAFVPYSDHFTYVYDTMLEGEDPANFAVFGDEFRYGEMEYAKLVPDIEAKKPSTELINGADVGFGESVSAWAPILNSAGDLVGMVEGDYVLDNINTIIFHRISFLLIAIVFELILSFIVVLRMLKKNITTPLSNLVEYVDSYQDGSFAEEKFEYTKDDEILWLSGSFDAMQGKIEEYIDSLTRITAEEERISTELTLATDIQKSMLPRVFPNHEKYEIFAYMDPAKEVGGDFYDFFMIDDTHLGTVIADVSGKGIPAALFMVIAKTMIKNRAMVCSSPAKILETVNNQLMESNSMEMFVTVWLGITDLETGLLTASSAGHEYPAIKHGDESFELLIDKHGLPLASMEDVPYTDYTVQLQKGDVVYVYTDGVPEATEKNYELFGVDRMIESLNYALDTKPKYICDNVINSINAFLNGADQFDDLTMLCFKLL